MYKAASLLQSRGEHRRALKRFVAYKKEPGTSVDLQQMATVNIVRSLTALGRCVEAAAAAAYVPSKGRAVLSANLDKMLADCTPNE
jgi:hypothetical protein